MIDKKLIIDFVKFLTINHGDETWFNAIQGDFERNSRIICPLFPIKI